MATVIFVHGINVRGESYDLTLQLIRDALAQWRPDMVVAPCRWGDDLGARLRGDGKSIPRYDQTRGPAGPEDEPVEEADLWALLDRDPSAELRLLALRPAPPPTPFDPRGAETTAEAWVRHAREGKTASSDRLAKLLDRAGLGEPDLGAARRAVTYDPAFDAAVRSTAPDAVPDEVAP